MATDSFASKSSMSTQGGKVMKSKKLFAIVAILILLMTIDYLAKVYEYNNLVKSHKSWNEEYKNWQVSFNEDLLANKIQGSWTDRNLEGFDRYLVKSRQTAEDVFLIKNEVDRYPKLPWHRSINYAYNDFSAQLENEYMFYKNARLENIQGIPTVILWDGDSPELAEQSQLSLLEAKPFPGFFINATPYD